MLGGIKSKSDLRETLVFRRLGKRIRAQHSPVPRTCKNRRDITVGQVRLVFTLHEWARHVSEMSHILMSGYGQEPQRRALADLNWRSIPITLTIRVLR